MEQQKVKRFQSEAGNLIFGGYLFCSTRPQQKNPNLVPDGAGFGFFYFSQRAYGFARCVFSLYIKRKKAPNGRRAVRSLVPSGKGGCGGV